MESTTEYKTLNIFEQPRQVLSKSVKNHVLMPYFAAATFIPKTIGATVADVGNDDGDVVAVAVFSKLFFFSP